MENETEVLKSNIDVTIEAKIDNYSLLDEEAKDVKKQMIALKDDIVEYAESEKEKDKKSILLLGEKSKLMVSFAESFSVNTEAEQFEKVDDIFNDGEFSDILKKAITITVPNENIEKVKKVLEDAQLIDGVDILTKWSVIKKEYEKYRKIKFADIEKAKLKVIVESVVDIDIVPKVQVK